jgi:preprotein translocase subunit SecF
MMDFSRSKFDIVGRAKIWYTISIILIAFGIVGMVKNIVTDGFPLIRGIDFAGGSIIQLQFNNLPADLNTAQFAEDVKVVVAEYTERAPSVQSTDISAEDSGTGQPALLLQIRSDASLIDNEEAQDNIYDEIRAVGGDFTVLEESEVGAVIGKELTQRALWGVLLGLALILVYITVRLSFDFAIFAVVALFHDVLILVGVYALFNIEINSPFVAVLLTVVGYSINDTIIIYDRIRENMKVKRHLRFDVLVNQSLLETMARSINTSLTTILAIVALLVFGGISLRTFMMGLGVGIATGTYSSIFIAATLLVWWRMKGKKPVGIAEPVGGVTDLIHEADEELMDLGGGAEEEEEEAVEPITVREAPTKVRKKRPKRRRRR